MADAKAKATSIAKARAHEKNRERKRRRVVLESSVAANARTNVELLNHNEYLTDRDGEGDRRAERRHARQWHDFHVAPYPKNIAIRTAQPHSRTVSKARACAPEVSTNVAKAAGSAASTWTRATAVDSAASTRTIAMAVGSSAAGSAASASSFAGYPWPGTGVRSDDDEPAPPLVTSEDVLRLRELFE